MSQPSLLTDETVQDDDTLLENLDLDDNELDDPDWNPDY
jgi:hypothetical protein